MRNFRKMIITLLALGLLPIAGLAQEKVPLVDLGDQIEAARKLMRTERRLVIATELVLTPQESKAFWPLYNEYAAEIREIGNRKVRLITEYGENFDRITEEFAQRALAESFDIDASRINVREKYLDRFKRVLPIIKVVRFYQVENKLDAVVNFQLAAQIPLMELGDADDD